ncbi:MAG: hypothetical protein ACP5GZ_08330 [Vulcanisaeta sp.]|jgi:hypothetical protein|uniref:hypothetical protein n=1 Tax=Vulcanisaeta sp. TaxID=2020871 RepID=UPI003D0E9CF4
MGRIGRLYRVYGEIKTVGMIGRLYPARLHPWVVNLGGENKVEIKDERREGRDHGSTP